MNFIVNSPFCRGSFQPPQPADLLPLPYRRMTIDEIDKASSKMCINLSTMKPKNTICLWFNNDAPEAAKFYAATFPDCAVTAVHQAPGDYPGGKKGDVLTVEFTVVGIPCLGLNGGPMFKHCEAFSFQIATDTQEETDRYWNAIVGNGGKESDCGWCKDRWGLSWQITPRALTDGLAAGGDEAKRTFAAMMTMQKIDVAAIEAEAKADADRRVDTHVRASQPT